MLERVWARVDSLHLRMLPLILLVHPCYPLFLAHHRSRGGALYVPSVEVLVVSLVVSGVCVCGLGCVRVRVRVRVFWLLCAQSVLAKSLVSIAGGFR